METKGFTCEVDSEEKELWFSPSLEDKEKDKGIQSGFY